MDKEVREIKELAEANARQTQFYKRLVKRTYRRIKGYVDYKQVAVDLSTHLMCLETGFELRGFSDSAWNAMSHSAWMAYEHPIFPVFAITKELAEAFLQTDLPTHVCSVKKSFNTALFLLPNLDLRTPDGYSVQWAFTSHFQKGETISTLPKAALAGFNDDIARKLDRIKSPPLEVSKLRWVSQVGRLATIYSSIIELPEDGDKPVSGDIVFGGNLDLWGENTDAALEQQFTRSVDKILLQTLLYLQLKPDAASVTPPSSHQAGSGFKGKSDPHQPLEPIWIGKDYKPQSTGRSRGSHASPRLHWRRGHWKRVAVGEGRSDRRWVWIEPTLVND
jgi:hypothetical protein